MPFIDLRDLVSGILVTIFLSMSIGQFDRLNNFARREALKCLKPWPAYHFFPKNYGMKGYKKQAFQDSSMATR